MTDLSLSFACGPYDRMEALRFGEVRPAGIDLTYVVHREGRDIFARMVRNRAFDLAEMAGMYLLARKAQGASLSEFPLVGLPVYPSRRFRHGFVFVNTSAGIRTPKDLEGKRVGVTQYRNTAAIWIRGLLQNEYEVDLDSIAWLEGGLNEPASSPRLHSTRLGFEMYRPLVVEAVPQHQTLSEMLADGRLDALISPRVPSSLAQPTVERLFPDYPELEREYFARTGIFPIMHIVVMRADLYEQSPWVAESMYDAFVESRSRAVELLRRTGAARTMLPWQIEAVEEAETLLGPNLWSYGLEQNRSTLETLMTYLVQQGFVERPTALEDIFVPVVETRT